MQLNPTEKSEFRSKWARAQWDQMVKSKVKTQKWKDVDVKKGRYISFWKVWEEEGKDNEGLAATRTYCSRCWQMGGAAGCGSTA